MQVLLFLIALQYHEVKVKSSLNIQSPEQLPHLTLSTVWADYIYLDTEERRRFAQVSHEYLIEQVQEQWWSKCRITRTQLQPPKNSSGLVDGPGAAHCQLVSPGAAGNQNNTDTYRALNGHDRFCPRWYPTQELHTARLWWFRLKHCSAGWF